MAIYKIDELLDMLNSYKHDGFEYVEIDEIPADSDEDSTASLDICGCVSEFETVEDTVFSVELPPNYISRVL